MSRIKEGKQERLANKFKDEQRCGFFKILGAQTQPLKKTNKVEELILSQCIIRDTRTHLKSRKTQVE